MRRKVGVDESQNRLHRCNSRNISSSPSGFDSNHALKLLLKRLLDLLGPVLDDGDAAGVQPTPGQQARDVDSLGQAVRTVQMQADNGFLQRIQFALPIQPAFLEDPDAVRQPFDVRDDVRGEDHRAAASVDSSTSCSRN